MTPTTRCSYKTEGGDRCVLTEEHDGEHQVAEKWLLQHWSKDPLVPYLMCSCPACHGARERVNL